MRLSIRSDTVIDAPDDDRELAFVHGRQIDLSNKQTALAEKYREKYRQLGLWPEPDKPKEK